MKLLQQHELSKPKSPYFRPTRTQPFIVTLFQVVMSFKRVAKLMKKRINVMRNVATKSGPSFLRNEISKANANRWGASFGGTVITMNDIKPPVREVIEYRCVHTGELLSEAEVASSTVHSKALARLKKPPFRTRAQKLRRKLIVMVNEKVAMQNMTSLGRAKEKVTTADRLQKKLIVSRNLDGGGSVRKVGVEDKGKHVSQNAGDLSNVLHKNAQLTAAHSESRQINLEIPETLGSGLSTPKINKTEDILEYLPGTNIYFGSTIALQARHGGYLSYSDAQDIKAAAHKIFAKSTFVVLKSSDLTDIGTLKYGDAVWLQAGHHEVLGAHFFGRKQLEGRLRKIHPALINCRRENMFKAQQYGRWIILNRDLPLETIGKAVSHLDKIILEQEWYFLASSTPYEASMYRTRSSIDDAMLGGKADLLYPGDECCFRIHLVGLPNDDGGNEKQRARLLQHANDQIEASSSERWKKKQQLISSLESTLPEKLYPEKLVETTLKHKASNFLNQKHLLKTYAKLSQEGFAKSASFAFLENTYGPDSIITQAKASVINMKKKEMGIAVVPPTIVYVQSKGPTQLIHDKYWSVAQKLLIDTKAWQELDTGMMRYYEVDFEKKAKAATIIQRAFRRLMKTGYSFSTAMVLCDKSAMQKMHKQIVARRKQILDIIAQPKEQSHNCDQSNHSASAHCETNLTLNLSAKNDDAHAYVAAERTDLLRHDTHLSFAPTLSTSSSFDHTFSAENDDRKHRLQTVFEPAGRDMPGLLRRGQRSASFTGPSPVTNKRSTAGGASRRAILAVDDAYSSQKFVSSFDVSTAEPNPNESSIRQTAILNDIRDLHEDERLRAKATIDEERSALIRRLSSGDFALPRDVFNDICQPLSSSTGIKFLRAISHDGSNSGSPYDDIRVKRRPRRPQTASSIN